MNPRKPAKQKILQGTFRKDRNPANEPEPTTANYRKPPAHLNKYAKKFWNEVVEELIETGVLTVVDWSAFEICCDSYGMYREAKDAIYHTTDEFTGKRRKRTLAEYLAGQNSQTTPELSAMNRGKDEFLKYANTLGLNPVARNRLDVADKTAETLDPIEEILNDQGRG